MPQGPSNVARQQASLEVPLAACYPSVDHAFSMFLVEAARYVRSVLVTECKKPLMG